MFGSSVAVIGASVEVLSTVQCLLLESKLRRTAQCLGQFSVLESQCPVLE